MCGWGWNHEYGVYIQISVLVFLQLNDLRTVTFQMVGTFVYKTEATKPPFWGVNNIKQVNLCKCMDRAHHLVNRKQLHGPFLSGKGSEGGKCKIGLSF